MKAYKNYDSIDKKGISIPLEFNSVTGNYLQLVTSIYKNKINGYIVRTIPDTTYYKTNRNVLNYSNFKGSIIIYNISGKFLRKYEFNNGDIINSNYKSSITGEIKNFEDDTDLQVVTVIGHRSRTTFIFIYQIFTGNQLGDLAADNAGGSGVPVGGDNLDNSFSIITNNIVNECLSSIVDKIINTKVSNQFSTQLKSVFGSSSKINLTFNEKTLSGITAGSKPTFNPDGSIDCTISIDKSKFNSNVSEEFIASTIIHEISHMLIATTFTNSNDYNSKDREKIMLTNYVELMKTFLTDNYNLNSNQALSMIFCGLGWLTAAPGSSDPYNFWSQQTEDLYYEMMKSYGLSDVYGEDNYYTSFNEKFSKGDIGTKSCKF
jgi:hypothetical protein